MQPQKRIYILGIGGTFMGGIARIAQQAGYVVGGQDAGVYPPMSDQLKNVGVVYDEGYSVEALVKFAPDLVLVGNALGRGHPVVEAVLAKGYAYTSAPQWLHDTILKDKTVIALAGTHGKTSTASMVTWILESCGLNPSFLIGGVPENFGVTSRLTESPYFVIEADEYDTAFFDKRSKFMHYAPDVFVINNLEFDHADIFDSLADIIKQFHHGVRLIPPQGTLIAPDTETMNAVVQKGLWSPWVKTDNAMAWQIIPLDPTAQTFAVLFQGKAQAQGTWEVYGVHNLQNALHALLATQQVGVELKMAIAALAAFKPVKRRLEYKGVFQGAPYYDDFAHHPTAIQMSLAALRAKVGERAPIMAVVDLRSNTMKAGHHQRTLPGALRDAQHIVFYSEKALPWDVEGMLAGCAQPTTILYDASSLFHYLQVHIQSDWQILFMSNGALGGIFSQLAAV